MSCLKVIVRNLVGLLAFVKWLIGVLLISLCLWTIATSSKLDQLIDGRLPVTYLLLGTGLLFLVDGTIGWAGVSKRNRVLLKLFLILTFFIFIAEVGVILTLSIYKTNSTLVADQLWHEMNAKSQFLVQEQLRCCGLNGPSDYENSRDFDASCYHREFPASLSSQQDSSFLGNSFAFGGSSNAAGDTNPFVAAKNAMNSDGCRQKMLELAHENRILILATSAALLAYQMLTMLLTASAISLSRRRRSHLDSLEELDRSSAGAGSSHLQHQQPHSHAHSTSLGYASHGPTYM